LLCAEEALDLAHYIVWIFKDRAVSPTGEHLQVRIGNAIDASLAQAIRAETADQQQRDTTALSLITQSDRVDLDRGHVAVLLRSSSEQ
jgi:hypothetical protein